MNSGCSGSRCAVSNRSAFDARSSSHRRSRSGFHGASVRPRRSTTITWRTDPAARHGLVRGLLHRDDLAAPREAVGRDQHRRLRVLEPLRDRVGAEPREQRQPHRAELRTRHHRDHRLRRGRQEDPDRVERPHAEPGETVREPVRGLAQLAVRDPAGGALLALPHDRGGVRRCVRPIGRRSCARGSRIRRRTTSPTRPRGTCRGSRWAARRTRGRGRGSRRPRTTRRPWSSVRAAPPRWRCRGRASTA